MFHLHRVGVNREKKPKTILLRFAPIVSVFYGTYFLLVWCICYWITFSLKATVLLHAPCHAGTQTIQKQQRPGMMLRNRGMVGTSNNGEVCSLHSRHSLFAFSSTKKWCISPQSWGCAPFLLLVPFPQYCNRRGQVTFASGTQTGHTNLF